MDGLRIDKWLWAARFYKTRALAARACDLGRVEVRGQLTKPAREIRIGDLLKVRTDSAEFEVEVVELSEVRGPAPVAQKLYRETETGRELRLKLAEERKAAGAYVPSPETRPSKRDRRKLHQLRGLR